MDKLHAEVSARCFPLIRCFNRMPKARSVCCSKLHHSRKFQSRKGNTTNGSTTLILIVLQAPLSLSSEMITSQLQRSGRDAGKQCECATWYPIVVPHRTLTHSTHATVDRSQSMRPKNILEHLAPAAIVFGLGSPTGICYL